MKTYLRLLTFAKPIEKYAIPYFFFTLVYAVFNVFNFVMLIPILETLFNSNGMMESITQMPKFELKAEFLMEFVNFLLYKIYGTGYTISQVLVALSVFVVTSVFISNIMRYFAQRTVENFRIHTLEKLRNGVFTNVMNLHVGFFSNERKGDVIAKITSDVQVVQFCITNTLQVLFREPFLLISYFVALIGISGKLTVFTILVLPISAIIIWFIIKKLRYAAQRSQETFGDMVSCIDESLSGIKIIKSYGITTYIVEKFRAINALYSKISRSMVRRQQLASPASEFLGVTAVAVILMYGGGMVLDGEIGAAGFMAYIAIFSQVTRPARALTDAFSTIHQGVAAAERVFGLLDTPNQIADKPDAVELKEFEHEIEFRNVCFSYASRQVINGISFKIKKGETVALVGASGGGKSTISDLIPRFYDVAKGAILIDGVDIKDYSMESLRSHIGVVAQDTVLFNDTIRQNIHLGRLSATDEEIYAATKVANAYDFIMEGEGGFDANIGDRGMKLSGGQRQRLSIARAVLKNPNILILDEATSALDTESERLVQDALGNLLKGRTSLVIAHRLSTIQHADNIIVVEQGRITEQGTHSELIALGGVYNKLIEMQTLA